MGHMRRLLEYWPEASFGGLVTGVVIGSIGLYGHLSSGEAVPSWAPVAEITGGTLVFAGAIGALATLGVEIRSRNREDG